MDVQREVDRLRELPKTVTKHTTEAFKAANRIAESVQTLQAALARIDTESGAGAPPAPAAGPARAFPGALSARGAHSRELDDFCSAWRAVRDRLRPENGDDGLSDAVSLLLNAARLHCEDGALPPAVLVLARAVTSIAGDYMAAGYADTDPEAAVIRELADGMVPILEAAVG